MRIHRDLAGVTGLDRYRNTVQCGELQIVPLFLWIVISLLEMVHAEVTPNVINIFGKGGSDRVSEERIRGHSRLED